MSKHEYTVHYPEAVKFLGYLQNPENSPKDTLREMPAWKKHFLSGYGVTDADRHAASKSGGNTGSNR
jgi:hypothetical protein